jgi:twitching motility two-component system response regulator PilH
MTAKRVLIVDDNRSLVTAAERILQKAGFETLTAGNGSEGLNVAQAEKPDLVILDIVMPGLNGYEVCRALRRSPETAGIPVLLLTVKGQANSPTGTKEQIDGFNAGAVDFVSKPVKAKQLVERVKALLWLT